MSATTIIAEAFGEGADLYKTVLRLSTTDPTASQLRKAYYKRALAFHPDKQAATSTAEELDDAKRKFHAISVAYSILSNAEKRGVYDESGEIWDDDDGGGDGNKNDGNDDKDGSAQWEEYFRGLFGSVTAADIDKFEEQYKCSEEEEKDVLKYYKTFCGDLDKMLECVMLSSERDKARWVQDYIVPAVEKGSVPEYREAIERTLGDAIAEEEEEEKSVKRRDHEEEDDDATESEMEEDEAPPPKRSVSKKKKGSKQPPKKKGQPSAKHSKPKKNKKSTKNDAPSDDLIAAIRGNAVARNQRSFDNMMAGLEKRYGAGKKKSSKKKAEEDIPDDEFDRIRSNLEAGRKSKRKSKKR